MGRREASRLGSIEVFPAQQRDITSLLVDVPASPACSPGSVVQGGHSCLRPSPPLRAFPAPGPVLAVLMTTAPFLTAVLHASPNTQTCDFT